MNNHIKKSVFSGFIGGIIATIAGSSICTYFISKARSESFDHVLQTFKNEGNLWMLLALGAILNLLLFFWFLRKDKEYKARGVLLATLLIALTVFLIRFI